MDDVKRFKASDLHVACCGDTIVVNAEDFDAQRLRADTAEVELAGMQHWRDLALQFDNHRMHALGHLRAVTRCTDRDLLLSAEEFLKAPPLAAHEVVTKLAAAEQRIAEQAELLSGWLDLFPKQGVAGGPITMMKNRTKDALSTASPATINQQTEIAREALKTENQRIIPVRFKCLACGDYHEGSGNVPCPKMSPYAALNPKPEAGSHEPQCLLCLDKKTVPGNISGGFVKDCPDCCGEEG